MRRLLGSALLLSGSFFFLTGFGKPVHSKVETQSSVKDKDVELDFKVVVLVTTGKDAMDISKDGKWMLQLTNVQGLKLETEGGKFVTYSFDPKKPGFTVKAPLDGSATAGKVDYTLKAFICKLDKSSCFFESHKGSLDWKKT